MMESRSTRDCQSKARKTEAERDSATSSSARKGKDKNAAIRISLEQHAERVAKKQRSCGGESTNGKTAAQRLADIRSRVLAKCTAAEPTADERLGTDSSCMVERVEDGAHAIGTLARRNELLKMHFSCGIDATGIQDAPACGDGSEDTALEQRCGAVAVRAHDVSACEGRPRTQSDTANEASRVAWHAVEPGINQPR